MWVNQPSSDVEAFLQAIQPFMCCYKITRQSIKNYNQRGRVANVTVNETINAFIEPLQKQLNTNSSGHGRRQTASYKLYAVCPEYVSNGDLIITPHWGILKVDSVDDQRFQGVITANLVRTGTSEPSSSVNNNLYEPN